MKTGTFLSALTLCLALVAEETRGTMYMDELCGETVIHKGDRMYSQYEKYYDNNFDCVTTLQAKHSYQRVSVDFDWVDIENSVSGCPDYLEVYDGPDTSSLLLKRICGRYEPADIISSGQAITLRMHTDHSYVDNGFNLVFTSFHDSASYGCNSTVYYQCENRRCVDSTLVCDGRNNCNDASDEYDCGTWLSVWAITCIVIGILLLLTCGIMAVCACCGYCCFACTKKKKSRETTVVTSSHQPDTAGDMASYPMSTTGQYPPAGQQYMAPPPAYQAVAAPNTMSGNDDLPPKPQ